MQWSRCTRTRALMGSVISAAVVMAVGMSSPAWASPGDIDTTFGDGGRVRTDFAGNFDIAQDVLVQPNGKIVVVGHGATGPTSDFADFALARYTDGGDPDTSFSGDGRQRTDFGGLGDGAEAIARQDDGKLVVVGSSELADGSTRFAVARYTTGGALDTTFSGDGKVRTSFPGFDDASASDVAVQGDGKIVVVGIVNAGGHSVRGSKGGAGTVADVAVARYKPNGSLDLTFGGDGRVTTDFAGAFDSATAVAILDSGAILVAGDSQTSVTFDQRFVAVKYLANGTRDSAFSGDGKQVVNMVVDEAEGVAGLAVRSDGKIVIGGHATNAVSEASGADLAVLMLKGNGDVNTAFGGGDGKAFADFGDVEDPDAMVRQDDGRLVFVGLRPFVSGEHDQAVWVFRLTGAGAADTGFGTNGRAEVEFTDGAGGFGGTVDGSGRILAVGRVGIGNDGDFAATRLEG